MSSRPAFPFLPKKASSVRPGDFWGIPLRRGGWYACVRILEFDDEIPNAVVVGLLDWCEPHLPTPESIAGAVVLKFGAAHIKTVGETGGQILGNRPLEDDSELDAVIAHIHASQGDISGWGYCHVEDLAHDHFGRHFPESPSIATRRPDPLRR